MRFAHLSVLIGAWLLVGSGLFKLGRPDPTVRALRALSKLKVGRAQLVVGVRVLGIAELLTGVAMLTTTTTASLWAMAVLYSGFTSFVIVALATGSPLQSCGCFGGADAKPTLAHVAITATVAATAVALVTERSVQPPSESLGGWSGPGWWLSLVGATVIAMFLRGDLQLLRSRRHRSGRG